MRKLIASRRRKIVGIIVTVAAVAFASVGFAYYAGSGVSASQSASLASAPLDVTVTVGSLATALYPGDSEAIPVTIAAGTHRAHVGSVSFAISGLTGGCLASWFAAPDVSVPGVGANIPANGNVQVNGSLQFIDVNSDQGACSLQTPTIVATANPTP